MSIQSNNVAVVRTTTMAQHFALGDLLEQVQLPRLYIICSRSADFERGRSALT